MSFVYVLESTDRATYVGATVDLDHRLRQHNGELVGGARATHRRIMEGNAWERVCHVRGFPDWRTALQFEWALKFYSRKYPKKMLPLERRMKGLRQLMSLERSTSKSIPYSTYPEGGPQIVWESEEAERLYFQ
jgi:structure-specific endonuclease subunit SLX1